ncbi:MAG: GFA family protein [Rhizobiaceae bacterium]
MSVKPVTGGCQCGAVRYRVQGKLFDPHICHCRMCQKAAGNFFMPLAKAERTALEYTRGEPSWFNSSDPVKRGFCSACGTPVIFDDIREEPIYIVLGSLDDPSAIEPEYQCGTESKTEWFAKLQGLPGSTTEGDPDVTAEWLDAIKESNHQHPDHDTNTWPENGK